MRLTFLGKESVPDQSPTLFVSDRDTYIVQGWIITDPELIAAITVTDDETIVEVPAKLMVHLAKDGVVGEVASFMPPIVHVLHNGNYIMRGKKVTDHGTLGQMNIPAHETCVEVSRSAVTALVRS